MRPVSRIAGALALATAALLLSACASSGADAPPKAPEPAPVVHPPGATGAQLLPRGYLCQDCNMGFILTAIRPPVHGLMLVRGGFMTPQSQWIVVDYDSGRIGRAVTAAARDANGNFALKLVGDDAATLGSGDAARLRADADEVWGATHTLRSQSATDMTWSLYLLDGRAVRHEFGIGLPGESAARLADDLDTIVRQRFGH